MPVICLNQWKTSAPAPTLPAFDNPVTAYALHNYNPVGYPTGLGVSSDVGDGLFTSASVYPLDYTGFGSPPLLVAEWADQNGDANPLIQSGAARPILDAVSEEIDFDGSTSTLVSSGTLGWTTTDATVYLRFKAGSLVETSFLFLSSNGANNRTGRIAISLVAGVLTVSVYDSTAVIALANTKVKTISDSNWHLLSIVIDTTTSAANQVLIWVDGSQTGVTAPISTDLASENLRNDVFTVGSRNSASNFFTGSMTDLLLFSTAHNDTLRGQWQDYINYIY